MKLKTARFKDVLSHVDSCVDFGETLTVFTGDSDSGKSGAMRGLLQLLRNEPAGIDLLRHGAKRGSCSEVTVTGVDDCDTPFSIVRRRGKAKNEYELNGVSLLAFGQDVPTEVSGLLRLSPHAFQIQSDGNFMLSATDGAVAKIMSATVGLAEIDAAFANIRKRKDANDTALRCAQSDFDRERDAAAAYDGLDVSEAAVADLEAAVAALGKAEDAVAVAETAADGMAELRPSQDGAVKTAALAVEAALFLADDCDRVDDFAAEARTLSHELDAVPDNAWKLRVAAIAAVNAWKAEADRHDEAEHTQWTAETAVVGLEVVSAAVDTDPAQHCVDCYDVAEKRREEAVAGLELALATLDDIGTAPLFLADAAAVFATAQANIRAVEVADLAETDAAVALNAVLRAVSELVVIETNVTILASETERAEQQIKSYKSEHPVCPECGAEQQHWHITEGQTRGGSRVV